MKKFIRLQELPRPEVPTELDRRILAAAAIQAVGYRAQFKRKLRYIWGVAAAVLVVISGTFWTILDRTPESAVKLASISRTELLQLGDFSQIDQENFNLSCETASQGVVFETFNGKEI